MAWIVEDSYGIEIFQAKTLAECGTWIDPILGVDLTGRAWGKTTSCTECYNPIYQITPKTWVLVDPWEGEAPSFCSSSPDTHHKPGKRCSIDCDQFVRNDDGSYTVWVTRIGDNGGSFTIRKVKT